MDFTLQGGSIHALVGANGAGKSTLMAILSGAHDHYRGEILIDGRAVEIHSPLRARRHGIHVVQQRGRRRADPHAVGGGEHHAGLAERAGPLAELGGAAPPRRAAAAAMGAAAQPAQTPGGLHAGGKTAGAAGARAVAPLPFLVLDEPTAPLDRAESKRLFNVVCRLQSEGIGIVFISHRIHELSDICDRLTVLRDGRRVSEDAMRGLSGEQIVEKMLGHRLDDIFPPPRPPHAGRKLLQVEGLRDRHKLRDVSLRLHEGEILGIAGLAGAGKTELCKALFGASTDAARARRTARAALGATARHLSVEQGLALVPEERRKEGIFIDEAIPMNLSVSADDSFSRWSLFSRRQGLRWAREIMQRLNIRASGPQQRLARLSGGNQQKWRSASGCAATPRC